MTTKGENTAPVAMSEERLREIERITKEALTPSVELLWQEANAGQLAEACQTIPDLLAEVRRLQGELEGARRDARNAENRFLGAIAHPEDYSKMRERLLAQEQESGIRFGQIFPTHHLPPTGEP